MATWDGDEMDYDLLVTIPYHQGSEVIGRSDLGDHADFVPTHPHTLQSRDWEDIFVIGDATNLSTSKAGSVAHFEGDILLENVLRAIQGRELWEGFDGHANCFIETGLQQGRSHRLQLRHRTPSRLLPASRAWARSASWARAR